MVCCMYATQRSARSEGRTGWEGLGLCAGDGMEDFVGCRISLWFDYGLDEVSHELVGGC